VPLVAHDMLLRFMNTDFMSAAGSAARVPSRIGAEQEAVIGTTSPNGTAIKADDSTGTIPALDASSTALAAQNSLTAYYNAGSAAVLLFLLAAVAAIFFCLRSKLRKEMAHQPDLGGYEAAGSNSPPGTPKRQRRNKEHRRGFSTASNASKGSTKHSAAAGETHELESLVEGKQEEPQEEQFTLGDEDEEDAKTAKAAWSKA
jgi:carboxypeptidase D